MEAWFSGRCNAKKNIAYIHCRLDGDWDYSMCERGQAKVEGDSSIMKILQWPAQATGVTMATSVIVCPSRD